MPKPSTPVIFWDVDSQRDFMLPNGALYVPGSEELLPTLAELTTAARLQEVPVVASSDHHTRADAEISDSPNWKTTFPPHCMAGTPGAEKVPETRMVAPLIFDGKEVEIQEIEARINPERLEILLRKQTLDVFSNPNTDKVLRLLRPRRIVIYGVALDFCHAKAVEGLWSRGYRNLEIVVDGTRAIDSTRGVKLLERWQSLGIKKISATQAIESLQPRNILQALDSKNLPPLGADGPDMDFQ